MHYHADDLCLTHDTNKAIAEMLHKGELESVSVIVTTDAFKEHSRYIHSIKVPVFLHFSLTEGSPVSEKSKISSLLSSDGNFLNQQQLIKKCILRKINKREVWVELEAQMEKLDKSGVAIKGIDSHQHVHAFDPIAAVVYEYASERNITCVRSYAQARVMNRATHLVKIGYWLLAHGTSLRLSPRSWREKKWRPFVMATWEKITKDSDEVIVVVHPGTDFDCQESLFRQIIRHFRYTKSH